MAGRVGGPLLLDELLDELGKSGIPPSWAIERDFVYPASPPLSLLVPYVLSAIISTMGPVPPNIPASSSPDKAPKILGPSANDSTKQRCRYEHRTEWYLRSLRVNCFRTPGLGGLGMLFELWMWACGSFLVVDSEMGQDMLKTNFNGLFLNLE